MASPFSRLRFTFLQLCPHKRSVLVDHLRLIFQSQVNSLCIAAQQELEKVRDVKSALVVTVTNKRAEDI